MRKISRKGQLIRDLAICVLSVGTAILLLQNGALGNLVASAEGLELFGSFVAGLFFTSVFTVAPATVVLGALARSNSIFWVAALGGLGALIGDFIIFRFIRDSVSEDITYLVERTKGGKKLLAVFRNRKLGWFTSVLGALIVASPLPDEIGLAMMGLSKTKTSLFIPLSFLLNFAGILIVGLVARAL